MTRTDDGIEIFHTDRRSRLSMTRKEEDNGMALLFVSGVTVPIDMLFEHFWLTLSAWSREKAWRIRDYHPKCKEGKA